MVLIDGFTLYYCNHRKIGGLQWYRVEEVIIIIFYLTKLSYFFPLKHTQLSRTPDYDKQTPALSNNHLTLTMVKIKNPIPDDEIEGEFTCDQCGTMYTKQKSLSFHYSRTHPEIWEAIKAKRKSLQEVRLSFVLFCIWKGWCYIYTYFRIQTFRDFRLMRKGLGVYFSVYFHKKFLLNDIYCVLLGVSVEFPASHTF